MLVASAVETAKLVQGATESLVLARSTILVVFVEVLVLPASAVMELLTLVPSWMIVESATETMPARSQCAISPMYVESAMETARAVLDAMENQTLARQPTNVVSAAATAQAVQAVMVCPTLARNMMPVVFVEETVPAALAVMVLLDQARKETDAEFAEVTTLRVESLAHDNSTFVVCVVAMAPPAVVAMENLSRRRSTTNAVFVLAVALLAWGAMANPLVPNLMPAEFVVVMVLLVTTTNAITA